MQRDDDDKSFEHRRGDKGAYRRYLDGMDTSMRQKVALVAAHLDSWGASRRHGDGVGDREQSTGFAISSS